MSVFDHMAWAKAQKTGSVGRKAVLMALAERTGDKPTCFPSQELIAAETEQSVRTVRRALDDLEAAGFISHERRYTTEDGVALGRGKACNRYTLLIDQPANLSCGQPRPTGQPDTTNRPTEGDQPDTAMASEVPSSGLPSEDPSFFAADAAAEPPPLTEKEIAQTIAKQVFDTRRKRHEPVPPNFPAVMSVAKAMLRAGWEPKPIVRAMLQVDTISIGWVEGALRRAKAGGRTVEEAKSGSDWTGTESGRIQT